MKKNNIYYINSMCDTAKTRRETHMRSGATRDTRCFARRGIAASMFVVAFSVAMLFGCAAPAPINTTVVTPEVGNLMSPMSRNTADTATITASVTVPGTLFWVLYTDGSTPPADAAALVTAAQGAVEGDIVAVSGSAGQTVSVAGSVPIVIPSLTAGAEYDFYVVLQDAKQAMSLYSSLEIALPAVDDTTAPTFDTPAVEGAAGTNSATVTIGNISESGTLYWALYTDGNAPADAAALVTAAQGAVGGNVVANSGSIGQAVTTASATVPLSNLTPGTNYDFYAVIRDGAGNTSTLSDKLDILTAPDTTDPTFGTPTISQNTAGTSAMVTIPNISESGTLYWALYTDGTAAPADATALVTAAQAAVASPVVANSGSGGQRVTPASARVSLSGLAFGTAYDFYAVIQDGAGNNSALSAKLDILTPATMVADTTAPTFDTPALEGTAGTDSATVTIGNISENGTLYWALYTDGNAPANATALIAALQGAVGSDIVANSGRGGQAVTTEARIPLSGLSPGTAYDFYAVVQDEADNTSALSSKLDILTPRDTTIPTFGTPAISRNTAGTSAIVTIPNISEGGILYWVLYRDGSPAPTSVNTLISAAQGAVGGAIIDNSGRRGQAVTPASATVPLSGLASGTQYDFYAVMRDRAGNNSAISTKLDIRTPSRTDRTPPTFGTPTVSGNTTGISATVTIPNISEDGTLYWALYTEGNAPANAAALVTAARGAVGGVVVANSGSRGQEVMPASATIPLSGLSPSTQYDFYAVIQDGAGNNSSLSTKRDINTPADTTAPTFTFDTPAISKNTGTSAVVTISDISEGGTLYWVLYTDGTAPPADAAALIAAAGGAVGGTIVDNSGSDGQTVTTADVRELLSGLSRGTEYDFYAVIQDGAGNNSAVSPKLDIRAAPDTTPPTFGTPTISENTATSTVVTIGSISEGGTLYWALYADGSSPADAAALVTAAQAAVASPVVANSGSNGQTVRPASARVFLSGVALATQYDFYAVIQDAAGNNSAVSTKLDILTPDLFGCREGETYNRATGTCGMTVNTCPTGQILIGSTCQAKEACTASQLYIPSRNACASKEYGFAIGNRAGTISITVDPTGKACSMSGTFSVPLTSTDLASADLRALAAGLANNVYQADIFDIFAMQLSGTTIPIRFTVDATNLELDGQIVTDNLPAIPYDANVAGTHQLRLDTSNIFPATGAVINGVPGRYRGGGSGTVLMGIANYVVQSTNC